MTGCASSARCGEAERVTESPVVRANASIPRWLACLLSFASRAAGYCERVTRENKSELLPYPLVDSQCGDLRKAAEAARYYAAVESATLNGGPMPSSPCHLRPYS